MTPHPERLSKDIVEQLRIRQPLLGTLCDEAADEIERLTALHEAAAARAEIAQIEAEGLQEENMFLRSLVADRLRALAAAKNKRATGEP